METGMYSVSFLNFKRGRPDEYKLSAVVIMADSQNEAMGQAHFWNERQFSSDEGWCVAKSLVIRVPDFEELDCCDCEFCEEDECTL